MVSITSRTFWLFEHEVDELRDLDVIDGDLGLASGENHTLESGGNARSVRCSVPI
jgi:hypothetical protein